MFTMTAITNTLNDAMLANNSESFMVPRDGMKNPMQMHIRRVPQSLDNWSTTPGIGVVRSTGSFVAIERRVRVNELIEKKRQGNHGCLRR
ncbi:hypothetical protein ACHQM5_005680 [Ranunculus cassubicifolius]